MARLNVRKVYKALSKAKKPVISTASAPKVMPKVKNRPEVIKPVVAIEKKPQIELKGVDISGGVGRLDLPKDAGAEFAIGEDVSTKLRKVRESYPLITIQRGGIKIPLASAHIRYDSKANQLVYDVTEPVIDARLKGIVDRTIRELQDKLEVDFSKLKAKHSVLRYLDSKVQEIWSMWGLSLTTDEVMNVKYYVYRDTIGYGKIDAMMHDLSIEDISCDGIGIPLYVFHRNPLYGQLSTNVFFPNKADLDSFVIKLAQKSNRTISVAKPLVDGTLPDGSRIQITYGTDIARRGSNFSIRKFTKVPLTPIDLVDFGELSPLMLAYLWMIIENQKSILIAGGTASGKTTLLNALSLFIMPSAKIVSIEDTAELQLPHSNWVPHVARAGIGPKGYGEIEMFDLLKAALRQRPEYIIVGEVRGKEAVVMFQAMATGHPALSTIHADSIEAVIDRLTTKPIDLPVSLLQNIDVIVFLEKAKREGKFTRRCGVIMELEGYDRSKGELITNNAFEWKPVEDVFMSKDSRMLQDVANRTGQSTLQVKNELLRRASLLTWMVKNRKHTFQEVSQLINLYYVDPNRLAKIMRG